MAVPASNTDNIENFGHCQVQSIYLPNNVIAATQSSMTFYEDYTHTTLWAGALTSAAQVRLVRRDNEVTMYVKGTTGTYAAATLAFATAIPARFRPLDPVHGLILLEDNTSNDFGAFSVSAAGILTIGLFATASIDMTPAVLTAAAGMTPQLAIRWHLGITAQ